MVEEDEAVVGGSESWWRRHGLTVFILLLAASMAFVIRVLYAYQLIGICDISYCYAGGSDSFYHSRVMEWIISTHSDLSHDPMLNYPLGSVNPREPLFDWMNAILAIVLAPLFGGDAVRAGMWVLEMQPPFWAAVGVFPVYLLGKEVSSRRMGLLAALLYPLVVGNIQSTAATYANYLPFYTFFVLVAAFAYLHAVRLSGTRRWVESYRSPRGIWMGTKEFVRVEETSVKWGVLAGVALGATMLAWQGYTYVITLIMVFLVLACLVERIRRHDTFGAYLITLLVGTLGFLMAMPYYFVQGEFGYWFTVPLFLFFGGLLVLLPFVMLRDAPWVVSVPVLLGSIAAGGGALYAYNPYYFQSVLTGQGYFVKNLIFSTVAEAQAPSFDALIVSYGIGTFLLTFVGLALFAAYLYVYRVRREHLFMVVLGVLGVYLPISAAKFFLLGSPVFVLLPAEALLIGLDRIGAYPQLRRNLSSLSERGGRLLALRRSFKLRHLVLGLVVVFIVLPNVTWAVDAGIPYNLQSQYSQQIYNSLPSVLQTSPGNASSFYLGIAGIQTDTPQQYDESGYNWLATQDVNAPPADRPAFISWWDYGFQAIDQGKHPSVADNFQEGIDPAGNFLLAQNESNAIALLAADLLVAEAQKSGHPYLPGDLNAALARDGLNLTELHTLMVNTSQDIPLVLSDPSFATGYGTHDPSHLDTTNAMYDAVSHEIASTLSEDGVVRVYQDIQAYTGWSIRYPMADTRLFPTSASNTGIYYAPVDLTDGVIGAAGIPTSYFTVTVTGTDGNTYPLGQVPSGVGTASTQINYLTPFYSSMIYHIEVGYNGTQVGAGTGIPGITLANNNPEPAWMMQHFMMGYRTAYYCPYTDYQAHPGCFGAVNLNVAEAHQAANQGTADLSPSGYFSSGGETILEYYAGATVNGQVRLTNGQPVPGVRVTINDAWGTPHMTAVTNAYGDFQLIAPPGNDSLIASYGTMQPLSQTGATQLAQLNLTVRPDQGFGYDPTPITPLLQLRPAALSGTVYWNKANTSSFDGSKDIVLPGATVTASNGLGTTVKVASDASGVYDMTGLSPGAYNLTLRVGSATTSEGTVNLLDGQSQSKDLGLALTGVHGEVRNQTGQAVGQAYVTLTGPNGFTATQYALRGANYSFSALVPGNYTAVATSFFGTSSRPTAVAIATLRSNLTINLTLETPVAVDLLPLYEGNPVPGLPVRFSPLGGGGSGDLVFQAGPDGWVHALVYPGNWSLYGFGVVNGTFVAGMGELDLTSSAQQVLNVGSLFDLTPAQVLAGQVYAPGGIAQVGVTLRIQDAQGAALTTITNASGAYRLYLPEGSYAIAANYTDPAAGIEAALGGVDLQGARHVDLNLATAVPFHAVVGFLTANQSFQSLPGAAVNLTYLPAATTFQLHADAVGNISMELPVSGATYEVTSSVYGFAPYARGPLPESSLSTLLPRVLLNISQVPVHVRVLNASLSAALPQVNFTALSPTASTLNPTGTNETVELYPGVYGVSAWAPGSVGGVLRPFGNLTLNVPIGTRGLYLNISFLGAFRYQVNASIPYASPTSTFALLTGPQGTLALNGTQLLHGYAAPPGTYNAWIMVRNGTSYYAYFGPLSLFPNGTVLPSHPVLSAAGRLGISFHAPWGQVLNASMTLQVTNGTGTVNEFTTGPQGNATLTLPLGVYSFSFPQGSTTVLLNVNGVTEYWNVSTNASADACALTSPAPTTCSLQVQVSRARDMVDLGLTAGGFPLSGGSGTVTAIPLNTTHGNGAQVFAISPSRSTVGLLPGRYVLYTVLSAGGVPEVNVTTVTLSYDPAPLLLTLDLAPGWVQSLGMSAPHGLPTPSLVSVQFGRAGGVSVTLQNISVGTYPLILASGTYRVLAYVAVSTFGGAIVDLIGQANVTVADANAYVPLPLVPQYRPQGTVTLVGNPSPVVPDGATVAYQIVVNNTGNEAMRVHVSGTPTTWTIRAFPANFTLGTAPNNDSQAVDILVAIPAGQSASAPPVVFQATGGPTSTFLAQVTAPLTIIPRYAITAGSTSGFQSVNGNRVTVGFNVQATGNLPEQVDLSVINGAELSQDGWSYHIDTNKGTLVNSSQTVTPGQAAFQGQVVLSARSSAPIFPRGIQVLALDTAHPEAMAIAYLPFPGTTAIGLNTSSGVTGPDLGSGPPPAWQAPLFEALIFVPFIVIVSSAAVWRWWRTRRWVRR